MHLYRESKKISRLIVEKCLVVSKHFRVGTAITDEFLKEHLWICHVGNIEQGDLHALIPSKIKIATRPLRPNVLRIHGFLSKSNDVIFIERMEVIAETGNFERAQNFWICRIFNINHEERV